MPLSFEPRWSDAALSLLHARHLTDPLSCGPHRCTSRMLSPWATYAANWRILANPSPFSTDLIGPRKAAFTLRGRTSALKILTSKDAARPLLTYPTALKTKKGPSLVTMRGGVGTGPPLGTHS
jgi:hypothetical protein